MLKCLVHGKCPLLFSLDEYVPMYTLKESYLITRRVSHFTKCLLLFGLDEYMYTLKERLC
jgi:hypothetical protein